MPSFEIEIKSLLKDKRQADDLVAKMKQADPGLVSLGSHKQLNHYFTGDVTAIRERIAPELKSDKREQFEYLLKVGKDFSVRTRQADNKVLLVIKATVDDTTSSNGTARHEFESKMDLSLEQLDQILLDAGLKYQAKWSREREEYQYLGLNVAIDKNAGYGYLAEFEKIIDDPSKAEETKASIRARMEVLGLKELPQDRLARMFDFYNQNWQDYYGSDKTFVID
jgi:predicted adenylyl cyclase CyaB